LLNILFDRVFVFTIIIVIIIIITTTTTTVNYAELHATNP